MQVFVASPVGAAASGDRVAPHRRWAAAPAPGQLPQAEKIHRVPLCVEEPAGADCVSHPVTCGIPIPEGALHDPGACRLRSAKSTTLPLQTQALARWPDRSVKWLLLDFQMDVAARASAQLVLEYGRGVVSTAPVQSPVRVTSDSNGIKVSTGPLHFEVRRGASAILEALVLDGSPAAQPLRSGIEAVFRARSRDGSRDGLYTARVEEIRLEEDGPLRAVVRLSGWHAREDGRKSMPFVVRLTAWAGQPVLGIQHTFIVSDDPMDTFFRGIGLRLPLAGKAAFQESPRHVALATGAGASLGVLIRNRQFLLPKQNRFDPASNTLGIYLWPDDGEEMDLRPALVRRPPDLERWARKYPDAFAHIEGGALSQTEAEEAFSMKKPCPSMGDMRGRSGMGVAKTHEIFIGLAGNRRTCEKRLRPFGQPLFAVAPPAYYSATKAFGDFHPCDPKNFPEIESAMDRHLTWVWRHQNEWSRWHGIFDYGDWLSIYDVKRGEWWKYDGGRWGWLNGEANAEQGIFLQFLRTGKRRWLDFAEGAARHRIDCDQLHYHDRFPELVGAMHRHYMTEHWSGQIDCGHIWVDGALNLYYFFGFRRGLECAIEGAELASRYCIPVAVRHGDTSRETNNGLRCLARIYEATRNDRYREMADAIVRAYLCSFGEDGTFAPFAEAEPRLKREFDGSPWRSLPELIHYNWHGHCGYQYNGYLAPAVRYWATLGRTKPALELQRRYDSYSPALDLGNEGQFFGEMYLETKDPRYLLPIVRGLPGTIQVPVPADGKGTRPGSFSNARLDYLYGIPYVLAALYAARDRLKSFLPKPSAKVAGYRAPAPRRDSPAHYTCIDLAPAANRDPRANPFGRPLEDGDAQALPDLKPGQVGFQPYNGGQRLKAGYLPVAPHHVYPSSAMTVTPNQAAVAGLPFGGTVEYGEVPFRLLNPGAHHGKSIIVLGANESVTIPIGGRGRALHFLGQVHGKKHSRQISQYANLAVGWYEIAYADGTTSRTELINGVHTDSYFNHACASAVTHSANFDWMHVFANLTDDRTHLNQMRVPLAGKPVRSVTFRSGNQDWGLLLVAVTLETDTAGDASRWEAAPDLAWEEGSGWPDIRARRRKDDRGMRFMAPARLTMPLADGWYEVELTVSGDPTPYAAPRLRVECGGAQVLADYCLAGGGAAERIRFHAKAVSGRLALELIPGPNHATGKLPQLGHGAGSFAVGSYGNWRSPEGNFTRLEAVRVRSVPPDEAIEPAPAHLHYGWLLPGATGEASRGGLIVDHADSDDFTSTTMKWKAGGFRVDGLGGRYRVLLHHTTYADLGAISVDLTANGATVFSGPVRYESIEFEADASSGYLQLEWNQPRVNLRCPRYAIRGIVLEKEP